CLGMVDRRIDRRVESPCCRPNCLSAEAFDQEVESLSSLNCRGFRVRTPEQSRPRGFLARVAHTAPAAFSPGCRTRPPIRPRTAMLFLGAAGRRTVADFRPSSIAHDCSMFAPPVDLGGPVVDLGFDEVHHIETIVWKPDASGRWTWWTFLLPP